MITFCVQTTDLKIGFIKISEFLLLLLVPIVFLKSSNKFFIYFISFFTFELLLSFVITYFSEFDFLGKSLLKSPYIISIGRYLELITCITLGSITYKLLQHNSTQSKQIIVRFVKINLTVTVFFVLVYLLVVFRLLPIDKSVIVYNDYRLKGLYVEGGPFGLMLSFIFALTVFLPKTKMRLLQQLFLFFVIAFLAQSKAGILFIIAWIFYYNFSYIKNKYQNVFYPLIALLLIIFVFAFTKISHAYVDILEKTKKEVHKRPMDPNLNMGRIAGAYIVPNMVKDNPVFGIGLGNYPLLRNNKEYRGFFTLPSKKNRDADASGLGGIVDLLTDMGIVGLIMFGYINYLISKRLVYKNKGIVLLLGFLSLFLFGVQLYFPYPWVFLGIILAYQNNFIDEISN